MLFVEALALALLQYPACMRFRWHAFMDQGIEPVFHDLTARGYRPTIDFAYLYGMLVPLVARLWYGALGWRPANVYGLSLVCIALTVWGLVRFARAARVGASGTALLVLALPHLVHPPFPSLVHALEPVFFSHALAEHARGRRSGALALMAACLFVKPSMAYIYGFLLIVTIARRSRNVSSFVRALAPAAVAGTATAAVLILVYGMTPVARMLVPTTASNLYQMNHFGFFHGSGRDFWRPAGARPGYYLGTVAGFWLAGTFVLIAGALAALGRRLRAKAGDDSEMDEVIVCCTLMHVAFVTLFFGSSFSWFYYFLVLLAGLAGLSTRGRWASRAVWALALLALVGNKAALLDTTVRDWTQTAPRTEMAGLWATSEEHTEWVEVLARVRGRRPVLLAHSDGAALLFPDVFAPPAALFVIRGFSPAEFARKAGQIEKALVVVVAAIPPGDPKLDAWPEFARALDGCVLDWRGKYFRVYRRVAAAKGHVP